MSELRAAFQSLFVRRSSVLARDHPTLLRRISGAILIRRHDENALRVTRELGERELNGRAADVSDGLTDLRVQHGTRWRFVCAEPGRLHTNLRVVGVALAISARHPFREHAVEGRRYDDAAFSAPIDRHAGNAGDLGARLAASDEEDADHDTVHPASMPEPRSIAYGGASV